MSFTMNVTGIKWKGPHYTMFDAGGLVGDANLLTSDPRFREVTPHQGYLDYVAVLTVSEATEMARKFYKVDEGGKFDEVYEAFVKSMSGMSFVFVHIHEI